MYIINMQGNRFGILLLLTSLLLLFQCFNPFLPQTAPYNAPYLHRPGAVIEELWASYATQDFARFDSLFFDKTTFQFFIKSDFVLENDLKNYSNRTSRPDSLADFLPPGEYFYLTYSDEKRIHKKLFEEAHIKTDNNQLYYRVEYIIPDTVTNPTAYKPVEAVVHTEPVVLNIESKMFSAQYNTDEILFKIKEQRFLVKRNQDNRWKIRYWYEPNN